MLRRHMLDHKYRYKGNLHETSVYDSLPPALFEFVCMIEHGADIKSQLRFGATTTNLAMSQLLQYNCFAKYKDGTAAHRHSRNRKPISRLHRDVFSCLDKKETPSINVPWPWSQYSIWSSTRHISWHLTRKVSWETTASRQSSLGSLLIR